MLISLLVFVIVAGLIWWLLSMLPIPDPFKKVVLVIFIVICIIYLLGFVGYMPGYGPGWGHRLP
jgi:heme A synthase